MNENQLPDQVRHANVIPGTVPGAPLQPVQLPSGQWVYAPQPQPQVVTVQLPTVQPSMALWLREMVIVVALVLAVVAVCTGAICAVVVVCGARLVGVIGTLGANLPFIGVTLVGLVLAAGWAATKFKKATSDK